MLHWGGGSLCSLQGKGIGDIAIPGPLQLVALLQSALERDPG